MGLCWSPWRLLFVSAGHMRRVGGSDAPRRHCRVRGHIWEASCCTGCLLGSPGTHLYCTTSPRLCPTCDGSDMSLLSPVSKDMDPGF